ncbi:MAG: hypothetical protein Q4E73_10795, partial [Lachnospiraceae bacterium]|nr:hypothetical protein [Lachnospiraceae bacterium]
MKQTNDFEDKILDNLLINSMDDLYPDFEDLVSDDDVEPSEHFQRSMEEMFQAERQKLRRKTFRKRLSHLAAAFALFLIVAFITVNTTSAWKEPLYNFLFKNSRDGETSKVDFMEKDNVSDADRYLPDYVPDGFILTEKNYNEETDQYHMHYENTDLYFIIMIVIAAVGILGVTL